MAYLEYLIYSLLDSLEAVMGTISTSSWAPWILLIISCGLTGVMIHALLHFTSLGWRNAAVVSCGMTILTILFSSPPWETSGALVSILLFLPFQLGVLLLACQLILRNRPNMKLLAHIFVFTAIVTGWMWNTRTVCAFENDFLSRSSRTDSCRSFAAER